MLFKEQPESFRLVISGTYSTGKTTLATALSIATGIPLINALSAREILVDLYPERRFQDMDATELMALGLKRMEERIRAETLAFQTYDHFISDGSVLNEWIYGTVRMKVGLNPASDFIHRVMKSVTGLPMKRFMKKYLAAYGQVTCLHAREWYTNVVHLPIEFPMVPDGHRPVSERYRTLSDTEIMKAFEELGFSVYTIRGSQKERLSQLIEYYQLPTVMPIEEAIQKAEVQLKENREMVAQRMIEQYREPSLKEKIKLMTKY